MKRQFTYFLVALFFPSVLTAQLKVPANTLLNSELERDVIRQVASNNEVDPLVLQISVNHNPALVVEELENEFFLYIEDLRKRKENSSTSAFLSHIYYKTHKKFLKNYQPYSSFNSLLANGSYDCLSATIMYALILNELGLPYEIVETDYHIYLLIGEDEELYMFESTDPLNGFVSDKNEINRRIAEIDAKNKDLATGHLTLQEGVRSFKDFNKLAGLQYFNASVQALQNGKLIEAVDQLEKARLYDDTRRIKEFGKYIAKLLVDDKSLSQEQKQQYLFKLTRFLNEGFLTAAL